MERYQTKNDELLRDDSWKIPETFQVQWQIAMLVIGSIMGSFGIVFLIAANADIRGTACNVIGGILLGLGVLLLLGLGMYYLWRSSNPSYKYQ